MNDNILLLFTWTAITYKYTETQVIGPKYNTEHFKNMFTRNPIWKQGENVEKMQRNSREWTENPGAVRQQLHLLYHQGVSD